MQIRSVRSFVSSPKTAHWIENVARMGYAAKGIVYVLVGMLAFQAACDWGGKVTGSEGAFQIVAAQPFGKLLLCLVAFGLAGYSSWQLIQAVYNPEHDDRGPQAIARRLSFLTSGSIYGSLAFGAFRIVFGGNTSSSGNSSSTQTASLLSQFFGHWLVGLIGIASAGYGIYCIYQGTKSTFFTTLRLGEMDQHKRDWAIRIGRFGLIAKGIVSGIVGYFFIQAARFANPDEARDTEGALQVLQQQPYGRVLMGLVALGLVAYGIHMGFQARYRCISPSQGRH